MTFLFLAQSCVLYCRCSHRAAAWWIIGSGVCLCLCVHVCVAGWTDRWWDCKQWPGVVLRQENKTNKLQHPSPTIYGEAVVSITLLFFTSTAHLCVSQCKSFAQQGQLTVSLRVFLKIKTWKLIGETLHLSGICQLVRLVTLLGFLIVVSGNTHHN